MLEKNMKGETMEVKIKVNGQVATCDDKIVLTASSGVLYASFEFSEDWKDMAKTALFTRNGVTETRLLNDDKCLVPDDLIKNGGLVVSVIGAVDGKILTTTNQCTMILYLSGYIPGITVGKPDEDEYENILSQMAEHNAKAKDISENTAKAIEAQHASEAARDESIKAKESAELAENKSKESEQAAKEHELAALTQARYAESYASLANNARGDTNAFRVEVKGLLAQAQECVNQTVQNTEVLNKAVADAQEASNVALGYRDEAFSAKLDAIDYAYEALKSEENAKSYAKEAETALDESVAKAKESEQNAKAYKENAEESAGTAGEMATEAEAYRNGAYQLYTKLFLEKESITNDMEAIRDEIESTKQNIVSEVLAALPTWEGGSY
jgi:hypothetical protein